VHTFRNLWNAPAYHWQLFTPVGLTRRLQRLVKNIDIAHLHATRNLPVANAARALARAGIPYIVSPHGTAPIIERRFLAKRIFDATIGRGYLQHSAQILAVSDAERRQIHALGIQDSRITVLPNPVDEREFEPPPDGMRFREQHGLGDAPVVLLLAKLTPRKGALTLLRAFAKLDSPDVRLVLAGSDMGSGIASGITAGDPRVRHIGLLKGRDRLHALAAASVVVYPSSDEVFGLVPVEALLAGSPVIVCNDSGAGEIIGTLGGGHIVPPDDEEALAGAIASILGANGLWRRRADRAAGRARQRFGAEIVCERLEAVYREVLTQHDERTRRSA
jgi:glycosyltransferase involved in cell wall biosynthesis